MPPQLDKKVAGFHQVLKSLALMHTEVLAQENKTPYKNNAF
jgi:hypothetical protein